MKEKKDRLWNLFRGLTGETDKNLELLLSFPEDIVEDEIRNGNMDLFRDVNVLIRNIIIDISSEIYETIWDETTGLEHGMEYDLYMDGVYKETRVYLQERKIVFGIFGNADLCRAISESPQFRDTFSAYGFSVEMEGKEIGKDEVKDILLNLFSENLLKSEEFHEYVSDIYDRLSEKGADKETIRKSLKEAGFGTPESFLEWKNK